MCTEKLEQIKHLNDLLRQKHIGGRIMITHGVQQLGTEDLKSLLGVIAEFDDFHDHNDPRGEHDCATLEFNGEKYIWKIDYYDLSLSFHSPDFSDPFITERVMTVMRLEEY